MYAIAVTNPEGRTRYVGKEIWWVDDVSRAQMFDNEADAQQIADREAREGWTTKVVSTLAAAA